MTAITAEDRAAFIAAITAAANEYLDEAEHEGEADWPTFTTAVKDFGLYLTHGAGDAAWGKLPGDTLHGHIAQTLGA